MCQALRELMAKEIDEELYKARCIGEKEGEENGQRSLGEVIKRLLSGEDKEKIRHSGKKLWEFTKGMAEFFRQLQCVKHFLCTKWIFI